MSYSPDIFSSFETPTLAKWNKLWANDDSLRDGSGQLWTNNQYVKAANSGGTAKNMVKLGSDNYFRLAQLPYQSITTNSTVEDVLIQSGWSFITMDASEATSKTITFPVAFTTVLGVLVSFNGETGSAADPTVITGGAVVAPTDAVQMTIGASVITTTNFVATIKRTSASSGSRELFSWIAIGVK